MTTTLANYQSLALRTEKPLPTRHERLEHALLGLITETGEIATEVKRMAIYGKPLDDERRAHIAEEIGDVMWYLAIASDTVGANIFLCQRVVFPPLSAANLVFVLARVNGRLVDALADYGFREELPDAIHAELRIAFDTLAAVAEMIGIPLVQIAAANIAKLQARFPDAYSNEAAEARADKGGLDARNS